MMDGWKSERDLSIVLSVFSCVSVLWSMFRSWCWTKRSGRIAIDLLTILKFAIICAGIIANVFFFVNICFAIILFLIFKHQSVAYTDTDQQSALIIYILIALLLKCLHLIHELYIMTTIDIFFVDWEKPKKRDLSANIVITKPVISSANTNQYSDEEEAARSSFDRSTHNADTSFAAQVTANMSSNNKLVHDFPNVTAWRSYFVANEWSELIDCRRLSFAIHIMLVILFLDYFGLAEMCASESLVATSRYESSPNLTAVSKNENNEKIVFPKETSRIAIASLVYYILVLFNIALKRFVYEILVRNKLNEFVDLCSVSNVSVFCMVYKRFGYYIHGMSANGRSDVNMKEMYEQLKREEDDLCSKRGLLPNTDHQTFEMVLPDAIHAHYHRLRSNLIGYTQKKNSLHAFGGQLTKMDTEKLVSTYLLINKFLSGFIEHTFKDVDYIVRDKTNLESILDVEFLELNDRGIFYNDRGHSFDNVLYYGLEMTLISFELMLFISIDILVENFTCAAILTYIISKIIQKIYLSIARKNLITKTLIDQRFLL